MRIKKKLLTLVVIGVVAVLGAMGSFPLLAGELDTGGAYLDGAWFVMVTVTGMPPFPAVVTFTPNILASGVRGTYHGQAPAAQFPTPAGLLTMLPSADGVWKRTGDGEYLMHEIRLATSEDGVVAAIVDIWIVLHKEAEDRVTGSIRTGILDLDRNLLGSLEGTLEGTPLSLEPTEFIPVEEANKAIVSRFVEEGLDQGNLEAFDEFLAPDFVHYTGGKVDVEGIEAYKGFITYLHTALDLKFPGEDIFAEGDKVVVRTTYRGTHRGEFQGIAPTGKDVVLTGICIFCITDGKITEIWTEYDVVGLMQQLGAMPPDVIHVGDYTYGEPSEVTGDPGTPEQNKALSLRDEEFWNTGDTAIADEIYATDFLNHDVIHFPHSLGDLESYKGLILGARTGMPDMHVTTEIMFAEGDRVVRRWTAIGTHEGELVGIPPTGKQLVLRANTIYRFADGKIVEAWWNFDSLGFQQQLGIVPSPE